MVCHHGVVDIDELWQAALVDAQIDAGDAVLFKFSGTHARNDDRANTWLRDSKIVNRDEQEEFGERLA